MSESDPRRAIKVAVVGGGLVGSLGACLMAQKGYEVHLYEYRKDIRTLEHVPGKSLTITARGIAALDKLGLGDHIVQGYGIPVRGRMVHPRPNNNNNNHNHSSNNNNNNNNNNSNNDNSSNNSKNNSNYAIPYGKEHQCTYSVGRRYINEILLNAGEKFPNLHFHFDHKLTDVDVDKTTMTFNNQERKVHVEADLIMGCDGAFSTVRSAMMKRPDFNYSQYYIPHDYIELCIPATADNQFALPPNYLHIWPRGSIMMAALPNQDKTFTITLFLPKKKFATLQNGEDLLAFFQQQFPDALSMIGRERLVEDFFATKPSPIVTVKCSPYNYSDKVLLLGDAAHATVPFMGQGMNCGMEDVTVLDSLLEEYLGDRLKAFDEYSVLRVPDAQAIVSLGIAAYGEILTRLMVLVGSAVAIGLLMLLMDA